MRLESLEVYIGDLSALECALNLAHGFQTQFALTKLLCYNINLFMGGTYLIATYTVGRALMLFS